jgi:two-component system response regulator CpxR
MVEGERMSVRTSVEFPNPHCSILLVEDDAELCALIKDLLSPRDGFRVEIAHDGRRGLACALEGSFDLVILDVMLPVLDGFEILRQIRKRKYLPVIMLTARTEREDRVTGLDLGADDYLPKPFWPEELIARVRAVLRRSIPTPPVKAKMLRIGDLAIGSEAREVWIRQQRVEVTSTEFDILDLLVRSPGRVVSRDEMAAVLYQRRATPYERSLDVHVSHLRKKLDDSGIVIQTIRNAGYMLAQTSESSL